MSTKKIVSLSLAMATFVGFSGVMMFVPTIPVAHGQTVSELQAMINSLMAQIAALTAQIQGQGGTPPTGGACGFTRDLTMGVTGDDVMCLQKYLNGAGFTVSTAGPGAPGAESNYFGAKTKAAVSAWQAANGVTPTAGYFGAKSKAKYTALAGGGGYVPPGPGQPPAPSSGLAVGYASDNPTTGSLIAGAGRTPVLGVNLTAGTSGGVSVTELKFKKGGVVADNGISGAYIVDGGTNKVIAQYSSLSSGVITFTGLDIDINAGQTKKVWLAIDPASGLTAGNTISFSLLAATDVMATDANSTSITPAGTFPLNGATFTVTTVSNPSIATLVVTSSSIGTSVDAGTQGVIVSAWNFNVGNSPVNIKSLTLKAVGSAEKADLKNLKLKINGADVGSTIASAAGGDVNFDLSASVVKLTTGNNTIQVYADVMGSPNRSFNFGFYDSFNVSAIDTQYNTPIKVTLTDTTSATVTINAGALTVTLSTDTPTGNVAKGGSNTPLLKVKIYAAGEALRVKHLTFNLTFTGGTVNLDNTIKNISLTDDRGNQVGSTVSSLMTDTTCTDSGDSQATSTPVNCFGNSTSPINYVVPANTAVILTLKGDIQSTADFSTLRAGLNAGSSNLTGVTSSNTASSASVTGSVLTLAANALTLAQNPAYGTVTYSAGAQGVVIGSYRLTASSAEGVNLSTISILTSASSTNFQNLKLMSGSQQFGTTQPTLTASATYTFTGSLNLPAGQSKTVDVIADILTGAAANTYATVTTLSACSGSGAATNTSISCTSTAGQDVKVAGQATLTVTHDTSKAPSDQIVMGTNGVDLGYFRLAETSNIDDIKVTDLYVFQQVASTTTTKKGFGNLNLYNGGTLIATVGIQTTYASTSGPGPGYYHKFTFTDPLIVPRSNSVLLTLKGDVGSYSNSGVVDNTTHIFRVSTTTADTAIDTAGEVVVAYGKTSSATSSVSLPGTTMNTMTMLRTKLGFTATPLGATTGRGKSASDNFAQLTFSADNAGDLVVNSVTVTFSGSAPSISTFLDGVTLLDENNTALGSGNVTSTACAGGTTTCSKSFILGATTAGQIVGKGTSRTWTLRLDLTKTLAGAANVIQTLTAEINALAHIKWTDATDGAGVSELTLPTKTLVAIPISTVNFTSGL